MAELLGRRIRVNDLCREAVGKGHQRPRRTYGRVTAALAAVKLKAARMEKRVSFIFAKG